MLAGEGVAEGEWGGAAAAEAAEEDPAGDGGDDPRVGGKKVEGERSPAAEIRHVGDTGGAAGGAAGCAARDNGEEPRPDVFSPDVGLR